MAGWRCAASSVPRSACSWRSLILEDRLAILPWVHYAALLLAVLASNREPVVRRHLFAGAVDGSPR
ncbi:MAG: hypothetical protein R3D25_13240 [Geminicoccaceae bacterium]